MRVGLNAFFLRQPATGSGQYLKHLIEGLTRLASENEMVLFSPGNARVSPGFSPQSSDSRVVSTPLYRRGGNLDKVWFEQFGVPRAGQSARVQLLHYPYFAAPVRCELPVVVTVHDLIPLILPVYGGGLLVQVYTRLVSMATRRATAIIADSQCSRNDIIRLLNIPEDKISVVYLAASERFEPLRNTNEIEMKRRQYGLNDPFVLYLGGMDMRKNVSSLLEAFAEVLRRGAEGSSLSSRLTLVVAGNIPEPGALFPDVRGKVAELGIGERVRFLGQVPEADLPWLYNAAEVFVFPSLYEGFGLPPLEAMACGVPVVCSNASSLPEVVGDAAITVPPEDTGALAEALERVLADASLRGDLRARGLRRAAQFSWRKTAEETLAVYRRVIESEPSRQR